MATTAPSLAMDVGDFYERSNRRHAADLDLITVSPDGWTEAKAYRTLSDIICRSCVLKRFLVALKASSRPLLARQTRRKISGTALRHLFSRCLMHIDSSHTGLSGGQVILPWI